MKETSGKKSLWQRLAGLDRQNLMLIVIILLLFAVMSVIKPAIFPTWGNVNSMLQQVSEIGLLSAGMLLAFLIGGIDLSVVSTAVLSATLAGHVMLRLVPTGEVPAILAGFAVAIGVGVECGAVNGLLIAKIGLPPILATLGTNALYRGIAIGITGGATLGGYPLSFAAIGTGTIGGIYYIFILFVVIMLLLHVYLKYTKSGFQAGLLGRNAKASYFSGINNTRITVSVHTIIGAIAALAGMVMMSRANSINPDYGNSYLLQTILICVVAGVDINGGFAKASNLFFALVLMQEISTAFNMLMVGYSGATFFKNIVWGLLLVLLLLFKHYSGRTRHKKKGLANG